MRNSYFGTGGEKIYRKYISHTKGRGQNVNGEPRGMYINHIIVTMSINGHWDLHATLAGGTVVQKCF